MKFSMLTVVVPLLGLTAFSGIAAAKSIHEEWHIKGISNAMDVTNVQTALKKLQGVERVFATKSLVKVTFDDQKVDDAKIRGAVAQAGTYQLTGRVMPKAASSSTTTPSTSTK